MAPACGPDERLALPPLGRRGRGCARHREAGYMQARLCGECFRGPSGVPVGCFCPTHTPERV